MVKNRLYTAALVILLLSIPLTLLAGMLIPSQYGDTFCGELYDKAERLRNAEGSRIVVIGGSAVAFGIDSALMERELPDYTVVNFGLYAALGTRIMLDLALPELRESDIVIVMPEQNEEALSMYFGAESFLEAADGNPALLENVPLELAAPLLSQVPYFSMGKIRNAITADFPEPAGIYAKSSFNRYGDVESDLNGYNIMEGGYDVNTPVLFSETVLDSDFADYLNVFAENAPSEVWYHFPPMNALAVDGDVDSYAEYLRSKIQFPLAGDPNDAVMDAGWFYDTNFHLNSSGRTVFTRLLVRDIKAMLGDSSKTDIDIPSMPDYMDTEEYYGTDSDSVYFTFETEDGAAILTGLTDDGLARTSLTVPTHIDGYPVTRLQACVFAGDTVLESVTIQSNIRLIEDGAFDGCSSLEGIYLESEDPSSCTVGEELLKGTDSVIYVPENALGAYKSHYIWSRLASSLYDFSHFNQ